MVVLALLLLNVPAAALLAAAQIDWDPRPASVWAALFLGVYSLAHAAALHDAVTPWVSVRRHKATAAGLMVVTVAMAGPVTWAAEQGGAPWAWGAGFALGALVLLAPTVYGAGIATVTGLGGGLLAVLNGADPGDMVVFMLVTATAAAAMGAVTVWLLSALVQAERGSQAQAMLAVTEERLRIARDLHDAAAQDLTVIGLIAELAEDMAGSDARQSARLARQIRDRANAALHQTRAALRGVDPLDLDGQLRTATQVLTCAGVATTIHDSLDRLPQPLSNYLASVVREAITNILRHSDATTCVISLTPYGEGIRLTVVNDRPHEPTGQPGTGLRGITERGRPMAATVTTFMTSDVFTLQVDAPREAK